MEVEVQIASDASGIPSAASIRQWVASAVGAVAPDRSGDVSVRIVDEDEMRALNKDYRDQDKPTNVLSFPAGTVEGLPAGETPMLGDIVVCANVLTREASEQGKAIADHWGHIVVHGTLHLLGHDHTSEPEASEMETLERDILAGLGIADPYIGN